MISLLPLVIPLICPRPARFAANHAAYQGAHRAEGPNARPFAVLSLHGTQVPCAKRSVLIHKHVLSGLGGHRAVFAYAEVCEDIRYPALPGYFIMLILVVCRLWRGASQRAIRRRALGVIRKRKKPVGRPSVTITRSSHVIYRDKSACDKPKDSKYRPECDSSDTIARTKG